MSISQRVRVLTMTCLALLVSRTAVEATPAAGPLRVHPTNPRYFTDGSGKPIFLTGSHTWRNVQDSANVPDFGSYLDFLQKYGHNCTRLWVYRGSPGGPALKPTIYTRIGPGMALDGGLKYDVSQFNQAFFDQLRARCVAARDRGIYVQVMLDSSETARTEAPGNINWPAHPYNAANNINGVNGDPDGDKWGYEIFSLQFATLTALNEDYARKVVDTLNDLDNVLYEIVNEANHDSRDFQYHMVNYIRSYEAANKPRQHPVGMTSYRDPGNEPGGANSDLFASPADYIAPGLEPYRGNPPAADGCKVIILDTDHIGGGDAHWVWKAFTRGMNLIYMDTWDVSDATSEGVRKAMGHTLTCGKRTSLATMTPRPELASSGYCLADPRREYLIYLPEGGEVTVDLTVVTGELNVEWMHPIEGTITAAESVTSGGKRVLRAPFSGDAAVHLWTSVTTEPTRAVERDKQ